MTTTRAISEILPLAIGVAISPLPIVAVVALLTSARAKGLAFMLGWAAGLAVVVTIVLVVSDAAEAAGDDTPATWVGVVKLVVGILGLMLAIRVWQRRSRGAEEPAAPKWMGAIESARPPKAAALGALLGAVNPKNLGLALGAGVAIAATGATGSDAGTAGLVFVLVATVGVAIPVAIAFLAGARAEEILGGLRMWLVAHNAAIMLVLLTVLGLGLVGDGIAILAA